jgi:NAD(P)-dependent dehydrogenase (short-subunit alcohol dehydrogenase family)
VASGRVPQAGYATSKGAVVQLTRELASQWATRGIRVNAIAPGWFASEITSPAIGDPAARSELERRTPMRRGGDVHELDGALLYLASDLSSYVTGHTLVVDGGWTIE